jgi:hypothetical protein
MSTEADIGHGTLFQKRTATGPDVWTTYGERTAITPPQWARDAIDASHGDSPNRRREFISGMTDEGEVSLEMNFVPGSSTFSLVRAEFSTKNAGRYRLVFTNGDTWEFDAISTAMEPDAPLDDKMPLNLTYKITGESVYAEANAPVNSVLPAISGTLAEGDTLTAYPGNWSGAPAFTYQWKNATVAINGATNPTYVLQAGDAGDSITVTVTATNAAGSASATSAPVVAEA